MQEVVGSSPIISTKLTAFVNAVFFSKKTATMKKIATLLSFIILFLSHNAFAAIETLPNDKRPKQWLQFGVNKNTNRGIDRKQTWGGMEYNFDWQPFGAFLGFQMNSRMVDMTARTDYLPFAGWHDNGVWRFGAATTFHLQRFDGSYSEYDISEEIEARWISANGLTFTARTGFVWRITTFDAIKNFNIAEGDASAWAEIDKVWKKGLELFTSLGSYNIYRYTKFFCPQWTLGAAVNVKKVFRLACALELGMTDFWSSVAYFNHIMLKWNARIMF